MQTRVPPHIMEINRKYIDAGRIVKDIPELPGQVLRRRNIRGCADALGVSATKFVGIAEEHFARLKEKKLHIPDFTYYVDKPRGWPYPKPDKIGLYTVVDAVRGLSLENKTRQILHEASFRDHVTSVGDALSDYYDWVERTKQKYFLDDVTPHRQFMLGTLATDSEAGEHLYMVDVDPSLHDRNDTYRGAWQRAMGEIKVWYEAENNN